ncbi:hypothetical protein GH741_12040 [Aquibacillus halophilus]|uniref:Uncharacterized protein n=1 Tax=Aquibacillus halophilus TaxID=930132 RepID=A0A6A8DDU4_9BACI|nr:hypothetical protein [Aquibacillus halophilus]MRH43410.1 hypothetical protein [Aquibacillus halophilus]
MGYILPVSTYQYEQYHTRSVKQEQDPFPIERLHKTQLSMMYNSMKQQEQQSSGRNLYVPSNIHKSATDKIYADLTGLGRYFNEKI